MRDWPVKRLSRSQIWRDSLDLRRSMGIHGQSQIDFLDVLRNRLPKLGGRFSGLDVIVQRDDQLGGLPALTHYVRGGGIRVFITRKTEYEAINRLGDGQEILGHELGHVRYHDGQPKAYLAGAFEPLNYINSLEESAEWQADEAYISIAAPEFLIKDNLDPTRLSILCNTTIAFAERAISYYNENILSRDIHPAYTAFKRDLKNVEEKHGSNLPMSVEVLWSELLPMPGKDSFEYKLCPKGFQIAREEYLKMTPCGWRIKNGVVEAYFNVA